VQSRQEIHARRGMAAVIQAGSAEEPRDPENQKRHQAAEPRNAVLAGGRVNQKRRRCGSAAAGGRRQNGGGRQNGNLQNEI